MYEQILSCLVKVAKWPYFGERSSYSLFVI